MFSSCASLASPLKRVREASGRLAAGDLGARAGEMLRPRRDEIGDVVRDFDAMAERLHLLVSTQKQLLSDISHELRSPLARLQVAVELARRKAGPDAEKHLNRIEAEGTRMNEMIGQLLTLARADSDTTCDHRGDRSVRDRAVRGHRHRLRGRQTGREVRVLRLRPGDCARRCRVARQRGRKRRPKCEAAIPARARAVDISLERDPDAWAHLCSRSRPWRSPGRNRTDFPTVPPRRRIARSKLRRNGTGPVHRRPGREGARRLHSRHQRRRRRSAKSRSTASALQSFTSAFSFLTARAVQPRVLWQCWITTGGKRNADDERTEGNWTPRSARPYRSDRRGTGCRVRERYADEPDRRIRSGDDDDNQPQPRRLAESHRARHAP